MEGPSTAARPAAPPRAATRSRGSTIAAMGCGKPHPAWISRVRRPLRNLRTEPSLVGRFAARGSGRWRSNAFPWGAARGPAAKRMDRQQPLKWSPTGSDPPARCERTRSAVRARVATATSCCVARGSGGEARRDESLQRRPKRSSQLGSLGGKVTVDRDGPREGDGSRPAMEGRGVHRTRTDN
jgi:hypothetical protein